MGDRIRIGVVYYSAGQRCQVEKGHEVIGHTNFDAKLGEQTYWFPTVAAFDKAKKDLFEQKGGWNRPVPVFEIIEGVANEANLKAMQEALEANGMWVGFTDGGTVVIMSKEDHDREVADALAQAVPTGSPAGPPLEGVFPSEVRPAPIPPPAPIPNELADDIFAAHAGRKIRLKDFANELSMDPEKLKAIIEGDPRYGQIKAGWVRLATDSSETPSE